VRFAGRMDREGTIALPALPCWYAASIIFANVIENLFALFFFRLGIESGPRWWQAAGDGAVRWTFTMSTMLGARRASGLGLESIARGPVCLREGVSYRRLKVLIYRIVLQNARGY